MGIVVIDKLDRGRDPELLAQYPPQRPAPLRKERLAHQIVPALEPRHRLVEVRKLRPHVEQQLLRLAPLESEPSLPEVRVLGHEVLIAGADGHDVNLSRAHTGELEHSAEGLPRYSKDHFLAN